MFFSYNRLGNISKNNFINIKIKKKINSQIKLNSIKNVQNIQK